MAKKKKRNYWWFLLIAFFAVAVVTTYYVYQRILMQQAKEARYAAFGIEIPENYSIHGIDVSIYQGNIHWPSVKQMEVNNVKIGFAVIKATEGLSKKDKNFDYNWRNAENTGVIKGAYHFFLPTKSGKAQAEFFIKTVKLGKGDLPPVLDIEQLYGIAPAIMRREVKNWLKTIEKHYGVKPFIYSNVSFYNDYLGKDFDEYPLWIAHYYAPVKPSTSRKWTLWQHSEEGHVNGIIGNVDFNVFNGDSASFKNYLIQ